MNAPRSRAPLAWVAERHSLGVEAFGVFALYGLYEATRGLIVGDRASAVQRTRMTWRRSSDHFMSSSRVGCRTLRAASPG